mmetsp:Transcript_8540/g.24016  ORF Transcript_8540/g.24016 Transcript_8540/m.24016 type:complete len:387 (-) Transcript_8540:333-1493(-)
MLHCLAPRLGGIAVPGLANLHLRCRVTDLLRCLGLRLDGAAVVRPAVLCACARCSEPPRRSLEEVLDPPRDLLHVTILLLGRQRLSAFELVGLLFHLGAHNVSHVDGVIDPVLLGGHHLRTIHHSRFGTLRRLGIRFEGVAATGQGSLRPEALVLARQAEEPAVGVLTTALEGLGHVAGEAVAAAPRGRAGVPHEVLVAAGLRGVGAAGVGARPAQVVPATLRRGHELAGRAPRGAGRLVGLGRGHLLHDLLHGLLLRLRVERRRLAAPVGLLARRVQHPLVRADAVAAIAPAPVAVHGELAPVLHGVAPVAPEPALADAPRTAVLPTHGGPVVDRRARADAHEPSGRAPLGLWRLRQHLRGVLGRTRRELGLERLTLPEALRRAS